MNMKLLSVLTPPSIYHDCSPWKTFWEEKFTAEEKFALGDFTPVNMKNYLCRNVMKHREIKDIDKYIALDILLELGSLDNMVITYSKPKDFLVGSGKGFITSPGVKANVDPKKCKKASYTVEYFSMKDLSNIIREFENLPYKGYERKRPKH